MPPEKRQPQVGDTWAYRGTRWKDSQITILAVFEREVRYVHERQATTKLRLFHKRFKFVCSKEDQDRRLREGAARAKAKRAAEDRPPREFNMSDPKQYGDALSWALGLPKALLGLEPA